MITAIVITYNPNLNNLYKMLCALEPQVQKIIIVDNGSTNILGSSFLQVIDQKKVGFIPLHKNLGIAYAQNIGIQEAKKKAKYVLLMDQDSLPANDMVENLLTCLNSFSESERVAAVGPVRIDNRDGSKSFFMTEEQGLPKLVIPNNKNNAYVDAVYLIASGTLILVSAINVIGNMKDDYFIDRVDTEWSFRARSLGYKLVGVFSALLYHSLGDEGLQWKVFRGRRIPWHTPLRHYYAFRNTILMVRTTKMGRIWKVHSLWRLLLILPFLLLFGSHRLTRLRLITLGVYHGIKGRAGKLNIKDNSTELISTNTTDGGS